MVKGVAGGFSIHALALAEHAITAGKVPEAVIDAVRRFHKEGRALDLKSAPSARRRNLVGAGNGCTRAVRTVVAAAAVEARPGRGACWACMAAWAFAA